MSLVSIENFLIEELPSFNRWKRKMESLNVECHTENFGICDEKACQACCEKGTSQCTERFVARFAVKETVVLSYSLEDYLLAYSRYQKAQGCKCDVQCRSIVCEPANKAELSMAAFLQPQQSVSNITLIDTMEHDFKFVQQIYPSVFVFD